MLVVAGGLTLPQAVSPSQLAFAAIPWLFALQQFCEGATWLGMAHGAQAPWVSIPVYAFLCFALVVWPVWVPLSILLMVRDGRHAGKLMVLSLVGILLSVYLASGLIMSGGQAEIAGHHIHYHLGQQDRFPMVTDLAYGIVTILPAFLSGIRRMWLLGAAIGASYLITATFYDQHIISVWCYFAALLSALVYAILKYADTDHPRHEVLALAPTVR